MGMMTTEIDTFPRDCEMGNGALRLGYSFPARAHDAALLEQSFRDGEITPAELVRGMVEIEGRRYSTWMDADDVDTDCGLCGGRLASDGVCADDECGAGEE